MKKSKATKQVTINISNKAYASLAKIAKAMNAVGWCGDDNTISTVIEEFCLGGEIDTEMIKENIVAAIDTMSVPDSVVDSHRRNEIMEALDKVA